MDAFLKNFSIPEIGPEADVTVDGFSIKGILNLIIGFINLIFAKEEF